MRLLLCTLVTAAMATVLPAQVVTTETVSVGGPGAVGCQDGQPGGELTGGVVATADLHFTYDDGTGILTLVVENTSPVVGGEENPTITQLYLNAPRLALDGITLVSQSVPAGNQPNFSLQYDRFGNGYKAGCMGHFNMLLAKGGGPAGGITNPAATNVAGNPNARVTGPATFVMQVEALDLDSLTASAFARAFSIDEPQYAVNAAAKFQGAGQNGEESGFVGNAVLDCNPSAFIIGEPRIGEVIFFAQSAAEGCSGCVVASFDPGPSNAFGLELPIGAPGMVLVSAISGSDNVEYIPYLIPDEPAIVGAVVYMVLVVVNPEFTSVSAGQQFQVTLLPPL